MKIAIVGAGAIGGYVGAKLALAGEDVTFIVRGANLAAIREAGITLIDNDGCRHVARAVKATDNYAHAGVQALVILAVKAHQVDAVADHVGALIGPGTVVVTMQNGIPFWYFHQHGGPFEGHTVRSVDPTGTLAARIAPARILGCVVYPAAELVAPGVIRHVEGERFPIGELDGSVSARASAISQVFQHAGLKAPVLDNIRAEIWLKLWGNVCFNPISALAHATLADICEFPLARQLAADVMVETQAVAAKLGITFRVSLARRIEGAEKVGRHKTSMLQDVEAGRAPEIDALVGSVAELGRLTGTPTPHIDTAYALVKLLECSMGAAQGGVRMQVVAPALAAPGVPATPAASVA